MLPWAPEFRWDAGHIAFLGAFYAVVGVVVTTLLLAASRARRDAPRVEAIAWRGDFEELPRAARACRHQLTGEAPGRVCDNAFDCGSCAAHPSFAALRAAADGAPADSGEHSSFQWPRDRLFHRGHTYVRPEQDGTVTVGLDDIGRRWAGRPERVELPPAGARLSVNGTACRLATRGNEIRVLSPVDGHVVEAHGEGAGFTLRIRPDGVLDVRHLLSGDEVRAWTLREMERLGRVLRSDAAGVALADGGELVPDPGDVLTHAEYDAALAEVFLDA